MSVQGSARVQFDAKFLDTYTGGDDEARDQVLKLFLVQSHMLLGRLEDALGNSGAWGEAAHSLKGCARSVGANTVADLAHGAEGESQAAKPQQLERLAEIKSALEATAAQVQALIHRS
jgi:HPt (histidine-containing phosphotransfer) domain-containing protein